MSNQEMQFADPDWKPSQKLDTKTGAQEQETYNPQPINADQREQYQEKIAPPQQDIYAGLPPYAGTAPQRMQGGGFRPQQYRRRARGPLFWIILAFIIISLMSGGFGSAFNRFRDGGFHPNNSVVETHNFAVNGRPTIVINDDSGFIHVQTSANGNSVSVQDTKSASFFGNSGDPNDIQVTSSQNGNTITTNVQDNGQGSAVIDVTVPQGADLQLRTNSGDISVDGVSGQMTLTTNSGAIHATNDSISGSSALVTNSGDITASQDTLGGQATINTSSGNINFGGTIATSGTAQFTTSSGTIDLTVPADSAFYLNASTNSGSMVSDFPNVKVQTNNQGVTQATGNVGTVSHGQGATVTLNTDSGNINLHRGS